MQEFTYHTLGTIYVSCSCIPNIMNHFIFSNNETIGIYSVI